MPYMPTNFYPKNQSIVKGELGFTNFYCLVNKYDTIYKAVLRLYSYYDESVSYPKKVFVMETRDGEPWKYDTSSPDYNLYNDAEDAELPFSTNEENDGVFSFSIANSDLEAKKVYEDLEGYIKGKVEYLSSQDIYFYHLDAKDRSEEAKKLKTLFKLAKGEKVITVTSAEAILRKYIPKKVLMDNIITYKVGDIVDIEKLIQMDITIED